MKQKQFYKNFKSTEAQLIATRKDDPDHHIVFTSMSNPLTGDTFWTPSIESSIVSKLGRKYYTPEWMDKTFNFIEWKP